MRLPSWFATAMAAWFVGEFLALAFIVHIAGWTGAIFLGILTSLAGVLLLRQLGMGAARGLRRAVNGETFAEGVMLDGTLAALGSVLLILPGFLSDLIGLALAAPSVRQLVATRFGGQAGESRTRRDGVVELSPEDWRIVEDTARGSDQTKLQRPKSRDFL